MPKAPMGRPAGGGSGIGSTVERVEQGTCQGSRVDGGEITSDKRIVGMVCDGPGRGARLPGPSHMVEPPHLKVVSLRALLLQRFSKMAHPGAPPFVSEQAVGYARIKGSRGRSSPKMRLILSSPPLYYVSPVANSWRVSVESKTTSRLASGARMLYRNTNSRNLASLITWPLPFKLR